MAKNNSVVKSIDNRDILIIDKYFENFFNKSRAVLEVIPELKHQSQANHIFNAIIKKPEVKKYVENKRLELQNKTNVTPLMVINERLNYINTLATDLIGLTEEEVKNLPIETRRAIQSFKVIEREEVDRKGNTVITKQYDLKLVDKNDSLKEITKMIGGYEVHNQQKKQSINLADATPEQLNVLLNLFTEQKKANSNKI